MSDSGHRCEARRRLELDHAIPVARGGEGTEANLRLRCRPHNQHEAERTFGRGFMEEKRSESRARAERRREATSERRAQRAREKAARAAARARAAELAVPLRVLGLCAEEISWAAELCEAIPDASLKERVRYALKHLGLRNAHQITHFASAPV